MAKTRSLLEQWLGRDLPRRPNGRGAIRLTRNPDGYLTLRTRHQHHHRIADGPSFGVPRGCTTRAQKDALYRRAEDELAAHVARLSRGETPNLGRERRPLRDEWRAWLDAIEATKGADHASYLGYESRFRLHVDPYPIASVPLRDLRWADVTAWQATLAANGRSDATRRYVLDRLVQVLRRALKGEDAVALANLRAIADGVERPSHQPAETMPFRPDETARLIAACAAVPNGAIYAACLDAKARVGEACALRWDDVGWDVRTLRIDEQVQHGTARLTPVKGKRAHTLPVAPDLIALLAAHRAAAEAAGQPTGERDLCFQVRHQRGPLRGRWGPVTYSVASKAFERLCAAAGVDARFATHRLRHSAATESVRGGTGLPTLQRQLRHQDIRTTMRYVHADDALAREDAERTGKRLRGENRA